MIDQQGRLAAVGEPAQALPQRLALGGVQPGGRLVQASRRGGRRPPGPGRPACAGPPTARPASPARSGPGRAASGWRRPRRSHPCGPTAGRRWPPPGSRGCPGRRTGRCPARFARPSRAIWNGASAPTSSPSSSTRPVWRTNPVMASISVVLPAPFGSDQAHQLARRHLQVDVAERLDATEGDREAGDPEHRTPGVPVRQELRGRGGRRRGDRRTGRPWGTPALTRGRLCVQAMKVAGHALGVLDEGEDIDLAAEQQEPVAVQSEPLVQRVGEQCLGRDQPGEHRARDRE